MRSLGISNKNSHPAAKTGRKYAEEAYPGREGAYAPEKERRKKTPRAERGARRTGRAGRAGEGGGPELLEAEGPHN